MKVPKGETNNKDLISLSYDFSVEIEKLFEDYIKENNLEQKIRKKLKNISYDGKRRTKEARKGNSHNR